MDKKTLILIGIIALLLGSLAYTQFNPRSLSEEVLKTSDLMAAPVNTLEASQVRVEAIDGRVRTEVITLRETIQANVQAMPADDVCTALNAELSAWRLGTRPSGLDYPTGRVLGDTRGW